MLNPAVVHVDGNASWSELAAIPLGQNGGVRVAVVRLGAGPSEVPAGGETDVARADVLGWLRRPDLLSVAVLSDAPSPKQLATAAQCDVLIASRDTEISIPPAVEPGLIGALIDRVGFGVASSLVLAGRSLSAADAQSLGLLDLITPPDQLDSVAAEVVARLLSVDRETAAELKSLLRRPSRSRFHLSADFEARDRLAAGPAAGAG